MRTFLESSKSSTPTIEEFLELLDDMGQSEALSAHTATLLGPRTRGSITNFSLQDLAGYGLIGSPLHTRCTDMSVLSPGCAAWVFYLPLDAKFTAKLGATSLFNALGRQQAECLMSNDPAVLRGVAIRQGAHGPELYIDSTRPLEMPESREITVIVGTANGREAIFTWHPGLPLKPFDGVNLDAMTAVKTHNG